MTVSLDAALRRFARAFSDSDFRFGEVAYRAPEAVTAPVELGSVLTEYFAKLRLQTPVLGGAFRMTLFEPSKLHDALSGWRFIVDRQGHNIVNPGWPASWIIIADRDGDAIVVDAATEGGATYGSVQQHNRPMAGSLATYLDCLAACMEMEAEKFRDDSKDEDFNYRPAFLWEVERIAGERLTPGERAGFMHFFFG